MSIQSLRQWWEVRSTPLQTASMTSRNDTHPKLSRYRDKGRLRISSHWVRRPTFHYGTRYLRWLEVWRVCHGCVSSHLVGFATWFFWCHECHFKTHISCEEIHHILVYAPMTSAKCSECGPNIKRCAKKPKKIQRRFQKMKHVLLRYYVLKTFFVEVRPFSLLDSTLIALTLRIPSGAALFTRYI